MDDDEYKLLMEVARERLSKMPGAFSAFQQEYETSLNLRFSVAAVSSTHTITEALHPALRVKRLQRTVDAWAKRYTGKVVPLDAEQFSEEKNTTAPRPANKVVSGSGALQAGQRQPRVITGSGELKAGAVAAESKPDARDIGADSEAENAASPSFSAGDIARQFWNMQLNMHRAFYPDPPHTGCVPVARIVHVLALRQFFALIENSATAQWRPEWSLERYARAAFMLNAAISNAAKSGALKLRDISTGVPLTGWLDSSPAEFWESFDAIFRRQNLAEAPKFFLFILRRPMHFQNDVVVNLAEFQEWAAAEKLAEPEDLARLLAEEVPEKVKRLLNGEMVSLFRS